VNFQGAVITDTNFDGAEFDTINFEDVQDLRDHDLSSLMNVSYDDLSLTLSQKQIRLESRTTICDGVKEVSQGNGFTTSVTYTSNNSFQPVMLLDSNGNRHEWTDRVQRTWEPMALRFCELVAYVGTEQCNAVQTCPYNGPSITRYQYQLDITLYNAQSGTLIAQGTIKGKAPAPCPYSAPYSQTAIHGEHVEFSQIENWLKDYVNYPS